MAAQHIIRTVARLNVILVYKGDSQRENAAKMLEDAPPGIAACITAELELIKATKPAAAKKRKVGAA